MKFRLKTGACLLSTVLVAGTLFTGCSKINSNATLVSIDEGKETISLGYYNFAARYQQAVYDISYSAMLGGDMWSQDFGGSSGTMEESVKEGVVDTLEDGYLSKLHASEYGIELSKEEEEKIAKAAADFIEQNDKAAIDTLGATEEYVKAYLTDRYYIEKVRKAVEDSAEISISEDEAGQSTISYVLYSTKAKTDEKTGEEVELTDEEKQAEKAKAETLLTAEDFDETAAASDQEVETYSYTTKATSYEEESIPEKVILEAKKLEDGERSGIIEVEDEGYYLVRMDKKNDPDATVQKKASLEIGQRTDYYNEIRDGWKAEIDWKVDEDALKKIKFDKMFEMSKSMSEKQASGEED